MYIIKNKYPNPLAFIRLAPDPDFVGLVVADVDGDGKVLEGDTAWLAVAAVLLGLTVLDTTDEEAAADLAVADLAAADLAAAGASGVAAAPEESPPEESPPDAASFVGFLQEPKTA